MNRKNQIKKDNLQNIKSLIAFISESDHKQVKNFVNFINDTFDFTGLKFSVPKEINKISYNAMIGNFRDYTGANLVSVCSKYQSLHSSNMKNKRGNPSFITKEGFKAVHISSAMLKREFSLYGQ